MSFIARLLVLGFLLLNLSSCSDRDDENTLIVGTSADNPPYEFIRANQIVGFDIDVIKAVADHLGKKVVIKNLDFNGLMAALSTKQVDLVIAGLSITPERQAKVDFSDIYASASISVLYRAEDDFKNVSDLADKFVGAQLGTIWKIFADSISVKYGSKVLSLQSNLALVEELKNKRIDAVILEHHQANSFMEGNAELLSFNIKNLLSDFAIAMPKKSPLKANIDGAIKTLQDDGTINRLMVKWLKSGL
jgi:polar amino acid transport system substrate-binding protein